MLNKLINRFLKPQFVGIASVIFRRDEILTVGLQNNLTSIVVTYRDSDREDAVIDCKNKDSALDSLNDAAKKLGLPIIKKA